MVPVMQAKPLLVVLGLLCAALAGCSDEKAKDPVADADFSDLDLEATPDTGVVRGVVVDAAIVPVAGATVRLLEEEVTTDEGGVFGFDLVPPGSHFLRVEKPGYLPTQQTVQVEANLAEPPVVKVLLERDPISTPYLEIYQFDGFIECSVSVVLVGLALCNQAGSANDVFIQEYDLGRVPTFLQSEMVWDSTQAVSDEMTLLLSAPGESTLLDNYGESEGPSPQVVNANQTTLEHYDVGSGNTLMIRVFNAPIEGTRPPDVVNGDDCVDRPVLGGCLTGVGATVNQEFTVFSHVFHNFLPPEGWQFTVDGEPVPPS